MKNASCNSKVFPFMCVNFILITIDKDMCHNFIDMPKGISLENMSDWFSEKSCHKMRRVITKAAFHISKLKGAD